MTHVILTQLTQLELREPSLTFQMVLLATPQQMQMTWRIMTQIPQQTYSQ